MLLRPFIFATVILFCKNTFAEEDDDDDLDTEEFREFFDEIDTNKDGKLTWDEIKDDHFKMWETDTWSEVDEDEDGFLSKSEYKAYVRALKNFDYKETKVAAPSFEDADTDEDGKISKDEAMKLVDHDNIHLAHDLRWGDEHSENGMDFEDFAARLTNEGNEDEF